MHGCSPFGASAYGNDHPHMPVVNMVYPYHALRNKVFLASGRDDMYNPKTVE